LLEYIFTLGTREISIFNAGIPLSGLLYCVISSLDEFFFSGLNGVYLARILLISNSLWIIVTTQITQKFIKKIYEQSDDFSNQDRIRNLISRTQNRKFSSLLAIFKEAIGVFVGYALNYVITFTCFPFLVGSNHYPSILSLYCGFSLMFYFSDMLGRYIVRFKAMRIKDGVSYYLYSIFRVVFIGIYYFIIQSEQKSHPSDISKIDKVLQSVYFGFVVLALLGFTHGHLDSSALRLSAIRVERNSRQKSAFVMVMAEVLGILYSCFITFTSIEQIGILK